MQTHHLKRVHPNKPTMIVGRGGDRGKTSGRGGKGQSARAGNKRRSEWRDIIKRLPKLRGRGVNQHKPVTDMAVAVNVSVLDAVFAAGEQVTPATLVEKRVVTTISGTIPAIKILGDGEISKSLKVSGLSISASAKEKIEKAGGSVTPLASRIIPKSKGPSHPSDIAPAAAKEAPKAAKKPAKKAAKPAEKKEKK